MRQLKILVVDDTPSNRKLIAAILQHHGCCKEIVFAENGTEAIRFLKEDRFDLVITDRQMPGMLGEELIKHIKSFDSSVKIVMMSGDDVEKISLTAGADKFLRKPLGIKDLVGTIEQLFIS